MRLRRGGTGGSRAKRVRVVAVVTLVAAVTTGVSGCMAASDIEPTRSLITPAPPSGSTARSDERTDASTPALDHEVTVADADYVRAMVGHHEQAVEFARLAPGRVDDPELASIAERIALVQSDEAAQLRTWLDRRSNRDHPGDAHDQAVGMAGEISRSTLDRASELDGAAFDRLFVAAMVAHHRGAIGMSEARLAETGDPAVARWARAIATAQSLEIDRLLEIEARLP